VISIPATGTNPTLQFWNRQELELSGFGGCYDGGQLQISTDGGATWALVPGTALLTDPYNGSLSTCCSNPAGGEEAWCGNSPEWIRSVVDLSDWAGQDVQFRFRLITDSSVAEPGWYIDDLAVQSCVAPQIFEDRFEDETP